MCGERVGRIIAVAGATIGLALAAAGAEPAQAAFDGFYGVNAQDVFQLPQENWDAHLQVMANGGLTLVRRDATWQQAEPVAPTTSRHPPV